MLERKILFPVNVQPARYFVYYICYCVCVFYRLQFNGDGADNKVCIKEHLFLLILLSLLAFGLHGNSVPGAPLAS